MLFIITRNWRQPKAPKREIIIYSYNVIPLSYLTIIIYYVSGIPTGPSGDGLSLLHDVWGLSWRI